MTGGDYKIGFGASALDFNQLYYIIQNYWVVSGCAPSDGSNNMEVDVASGTVIHDGNVVSVASQTATLNSSDSDPRKDVIYIDSGGNAQVTTGTAAPAEPSGDTQFDTYHPTPPSLESTTGVIVGEVWVGAGTSDIQSGDIRDRSGSIDTIEQIDYSPGHTNWEDGLSNEEVHRYPGVSGEAYSIREISFMQKNGGSSNSASLDVYDPVANSQLTSVNLGGYDTGEVTGNQGNKIIIRISNSTGSSIDAAPRIDGWRL
jgi:hypothetical protein